MLQPGEVFAGYVIERRLGAGGMGEVYVARHPRLPRREALKVLAANLADDAQFRARFEREADLAASLSHQNIVAVHDRGEADGRLWIALDLVDGVDLGEVVRRAPIPVDEVARVVGDVAAALDFAGARGLIHRDVKPANIMVSSTGRVLLTDFGIARLGAENSDLTGTGMTLGTISYASPEQLQGLPVDARSDQYSLAATAFHLLTGAVPFANTNAGAVIVAQVTAPVPSVRVSRPELSPRVDAAIARAMAKSPADRFASSEAFAAELRTALAEGEAGAASSAPTLVRGATTTPSVPALGPDLAQAHLAPPAPSPSPEKRGRRRYRTVVVVAAVITVVVLIAGAAAFYVMRPTNSADSASAGVLAASDFGYCAARQGVLACTTGTSGESLKLVPGLSGVTDVATDGVNTCAVASGDLWCWGDNTNGQLGIDGAQLSSTTPQRVQGISDVTDVAVGDHTACAVSAGSVYCWGKLGTSDSGRGKVTRPEKVGTITGATSVTTSEGTSCAVADKAAWCWGDNRGGEAGTGNTNSIPNESPVKLQNLGTSVTAIVTSHQLTCALADRQPACWGSANWLRLANPGSNKAAENVYGMSGISASRRRTSVTS
ncbi:protein kinase [Tsukamurella sp. NPDC003166]|uniref:protein kinase domain-containing protein n=1 Tax=Tsukamurella sp. NPDC003166 TaxID=3154444 RepID=UPI0033B0F76E